MKFVYTGGSVHRAGPPSSARRSSRARVGASGGADTAKVRSVMEVAARRATGSRVRMTTDLDIKGRAAQMGAGRHRGRESSPGEPGRGLHRGAPGGPGWTRPASPCRLRDLSAASRLDGVGRRLAASAGWPPGAAAAAGTTAGCPSRPRRRRCTAAPKEPTMDRADLTLSAGPNDLSAEVRAALGSPILYHYDPVFLERFRPAEQQIGADLPDHQPRDHPHAGRGGAGPGGGRPRRGLARHGLSQPRLRRLRQGLRLLARRPSARSCTRSRCPTTRRSTRARSTRTWTRTRRSGWCRVVHSETPSGHAQPGSRARAASPAPTTRSPSWTCVSSFGGIELESGGVAAGPARGRAPEVPRRPARDVAHGGQRRGVGGHRPEPGGAARLVPVDARLARAVARQRSLPVHAVGVRPARRAGRRERAARRGPRRGPGAPRPHRACRAGPASRRWACGRGPRARRSQRPA